LLRIIALSVTMTLLSSCARQTVVNKIKLIQTIGYDSSEEGLQGTFLIGSYKKRGEPDEELLESVSSSDSTIMTTLNGKTNGPIEYGQLSMVLLGKSYSQQGIEPIFHILCRDVKISSRLQLGVADGKASELIKLINRHKEPFLLSNIIEQNVKNGNLPHTNLHVSLDDFYGEGQDVFLPLFKADGGEITLNGLALFKGDKYAASISMKEAFLLRLLLENTKNAKFIAHVPGHNKKGEDLLLRSVNSEVSYERIEGAPAPSMTIKLDIKAEVAQAPEWIDLSSKEMHSRLENKLKDYYTQQLEAFIAFCKSKQVDPAGFGDVVRSRTRTWKEEPFYEAYGTMGTKVEVQFSIVQAGLGE
jgi:spore germination protein